MAWSDYPAMFHGKFNVTMNSSKQHAKSLKIEYVTDPVLIPGLRCPHCHGKVGQIRNHDPVNKNFWPVALAEPIIWIIFGVATYLGYLYETVFWVALPLLIFAPLFAIWMYVKDIRRSDFICKACNVQSSYATVSKQRHPN